MRTPLSARAERSLLLIPALALLTVVGGREAAIEVASAASVTRPAASRGAVHATDIRHPTPDARVLRVCADPNNLPFSNDRGEGFENKIAEVVARDLGARVEYTWWAQRRGFFRHTLRERRCDVVMGVPARFEMALTTRPYYRSSYVFVTRRGAPRVRSFDDPALRTARIGVQLVGDDYVNTPPTQALARRGIVNNVRGYMLYGDYREAAPTARILRAVADGEVDVAVVWGPLAGYFAPRARVPLDLVAVSPAVDPPGVPLAFDIALGVRRGETAFRDTLDRVLDRRRAEVRRILDAYGVPRVAPPNGEGAHGR